MRQFKWQYFNDINHVNISRCVIYRSVFDIPSDSMSFLESYSCERNTSRDPKIHHTHQTQKPSKLHQNSAKPTPQKKGLRITLSPFLKRDTTDRTRTGTSRKTTDFKSAASTNSATVAFARSPSCHLWTRSPLAICGRRLLTRFDYVNGSFQRLFNIFVTFFVSGL